MSIDFNNNVDRFGSDIEKSEVARVVCEELLGNCGTIEELNNKLQKHLNDGSLVEIRRTEGSGLPTRYYTDYDSDKILVLEKSEDSTKVKLFLPDKSEGYYYHLSFVKGKIAAKDKYKENSDFKMGLDEKRFYYNEGESSTEGVDFFIHSREAYEGWQEIIIEKKFDESTGFLDSYIEEIIYKDGTRLRVKGQDGKETIEQLEVSKPLVDQEMALKKIAALKRAHNLIRSNDNNS